MATVEHKRKAAAQTGIYIIVIAAIVVIANIISAGVYGRIDATKNERYTLSKGSARLVAGLTEQMQIDFYITTGLAQLDLFVRDVTDLLKEYERASEGQFKFTIIEPDTDELKEKAKEAGLQPMLFQATEATSDDQAQLKEGYLGLVFKYGGEKAVMPTPSPGPGGAQGFEFWITNKIREIRDKEEDIKHRIGVITNKDELKLSDTNLTPRQGQGGHSIQSVLTRAFPFYTIEEVDLKDGGEEIDPELSGLILTQPRKVYTDKELRRIDQFLMKGNKALTVIASAVTLKPNDATMEATLDLHNIDKLLAGYGISMKNDAVMDHGAQFRISVPTQTGMAQIRHPGIADVVEDNSDEETKVLDTSFAGFFRLQQLAFPFPSTLELLPEKQPDDVKVYAVARTTPQATAETGSTVKMNLRAEWPQSGEKAQRIIAAVAEGKLKSAFAGGGADEGIKTAERASEPSRVLVISSSLFLTNPFAYAGNGPELGGQFQMFGNIGGDQQLLFVARPYVQYLQGTILAVKNILDWMSGDADLIATSAKIMGEAPLTYREVSKPKAADGDDEEAIRKKEEQYRQRLKSVQDRVQLGLIVGLPLFFAGFGIFRWRSREAKRGRIKV